MSLVLRLDKAAVEYLIETAGPEFQLELTNAVISAAAKRFVSKAAPQHVEAAIQREFWDVLRGLEKHKPANNERVEEFERRVRNLANSATNDMVTAAVKKTVATFETRIEAAINDQVQYQVAQRIQNGVSDRINGLLRTAAGGAGS